MKKQPMEYELSEIIKNIKEKINLEYEDVPEDEPEPEQE
jgi:hypothetical protein